LHLFCSDIFCCLGTTRADAGGAENFIKIDQEYVLNSAKIIAEENKPTTSESKLSPVHFLYCSSAVSYTTVHSIYIFTLYSSIYSQYSGIKQEFTIFVSQD
jgi:hypothetical protein